MNEMEETSHFRALKEHARPVSILHIRNITNKQCARLITLSEALKAGAVYEGYFTTFQKTTPSVHISYFRSYTQIDHELCSNEI
jgi:hypothetical protein